MVDVQLTTRQKLIDTANELIWRSSYGAVSVDDICRAAQVHKGSFYHYFKSKADLALATLEAHYEKTRPLFDAALSPSHLPMQRLENLVGLVIEKQERALGDYGRVCGCPFGALGSEMAGQDERIVNKINEIFSHYDRYTATMIRDLAAEGLLPSGVDVDAMVAELRNYMMGMVMMARIQNSLDGLYRDLRPGAFRVLGLSGVDNVEMVSA